MYNGWYPHEIDDHADHLIDIKRIAWAAEMFQTSNSHSYVQKSGFLYLAKVVPTLRDYLRNKDKFVRLERVCRPLNGPTSCIEEIN